MFIFTTRDLAPFDLATALLSTPLTSLVIALIITAALVLFSGRINRRADLSLSTTDALSVRRKYAPERPLITIGALAVVAALVVENVIRGYVLDMVDDVSWWRFATPVAVAALANAVLLAAILARGSGPTESPVVTGTRRTWTSFSTRTALITGIAATLLLIVTTIAAGLSSSPDRHGRYVWLEIPIPNESSVDPLRLWFYGWSFGVPVLVALTALIAATWAALHVNAARSFIRPSTTSAERSLRADTARGVVKIAAAAILLALAGASRLMAAAGATTQLWIEGQNGGEPYEVIWRYAELVSTAGWLAPAVEVVAFALLLTAGGLRRKPIPSSPTEHPQMSLPIAEPRP